jgi:hypothetical protein
MIWIVFKVDLNKSLGVMNYKLTPNLQICLWAYAITKPNNNSNTKTHPSSTSKSIRLVVLPILSG